MLYVFRYLKAPETGLLLFNERIYKLRKKTKESILQCSLPPN